MNISTASNSHTYILYIINLTHRSFCPYSTFCSRCPLLTII